MATLAAHELQPAVAHYAVEDLNPPDASFYVGQSTDLVVRLQEHRDGLQHQTKGKNPRLVYIESFEGGRSAVGERERQLTEVTKSGLGLRHLRELIETWRAPLRLIDLNA